MIINFHPQEIPSKSGLAIIEDFKTKKPQLEVFLPQDKTVLEWQEAIKSSHEIIMVAPTYWWGTGYEMDKWLQEVFTYNFAYSFDTGSKAGLLAGREFTIHMTHGTPVDQAIEMHKNIKDRLEKGVFGYCDAKININFHFTG